MGKPSREYPQNVIEGAVGVAFGSTALIANAGHSVADLAASGVVHIWGPTAFEPLDTTHQHGHDRFEPLTALIAGGALVPLGGILLYESVEKYLRGNEATFSIFLVGALLFSMVDMYGTYRYTERLNQIVNSSSLHSLARDCLNYFYTIIAALVGVLGVWAGYPVLDPVAGALISLVVMKEGVELARENVSYLLDRAPPKETQEQILATIEDHPDVHGVHDVAMYYSGTDIEVEFHAEIDADRPFEDAHALETDLIQTFSERMVSAMSMFISTHPRESTRAQVRGHSHTLTVNRNSFVPLFRELHHNTFSLLFQTALQ
ncbi:cation diffusion facilitator family transporter [Haladaptatus sp. R4]|uniref:cation diffusion facilitator family transporter n=1 Tax=Haladaptatus sp. R4 TaxID=1679489 RepID=UPI000AE532B3|nr:cation diffusion facilitator family transporter [Haladaptatus sp. R4]